MNKDPNRREVLAGFAVAVAAAALPAAASVASAAEAPAALKAWQKPSLSRCIDWIGGNCPVQAEGTIDGKPFYFRARGKHWSMGIGGDPVLEPEWFREVEWGDGPFAAGWMPETEAGQLIEHCAADYSAGKPGLQKPETPG